MGKQGDFLAKISERANQVAREQDADVLLVNASIDYKPVRQAQMECMGVSSRRPNCFMVLTTYGGDPNAAYRLSRFLQRNYSNLTVCLPGVCKSAGTLAAIGANDLVMSEFSELGPLDIQIRKPDELWEMSSGLTDLKAIDALRDNAFSTFESHMLELKVRSGITMKTCLQVATQLTVGLFEPIYRQIDPMRLGENSRAMAIGQEYGRRLNRISANLKPDALERLLVGYPTHVFSIDIDEARQLFHRVREPSVEESCLIESLGSICVEPSGEDLIQLLSTPQETTAEEGEDNEKQEPVGADSKGAERETGKPSQEKAKSGVTAIDSKIA